VADPEVADCAVERMSVDDAIRTAEAIEANGRAWIKALTPLLEVLLAGDARCLDELTEETVHNLIISACSRARRICRADLDSGGPLGQ
jgi:hypothetical protein